MFRSNTSELFESSERENEFVTVLTDEENNMTTIPLEANLGLALLLLQLSTRQARQNADNTHTEDLHQNLTPERIFSPLPGEDAGLAPNAQISDATTELPTMNLPLGDRSFSPEMIAMGEFITNLIQGLRERQ